MLYNKDFLLKLDSYKHRVVYARITALTFQENPIEYIEGRVTQGSINVDGDSAVRRTCSLTIAAPEFNYNNFYWGLNSKFKLEIGLENNIDPSYPDIIWFKQGTYLITSFSTTRNQTSFNISIQGKDKMCLLNGDIGGSLESSVDFGKIEEEDQNGNWVVTPITIPDIIRNMVHTYAGEPYYNIIINDLDTYGLELLEYRYETPLFFYRNADGDQNAVPLYDNVFLDNGATQCSVHEKIGTEFSSEPIDLIIDGVSKKQVLLNELPLDYLDALTERLLPNNDGHYAIKVINGSGFNKDSYYYMAKVEYGQSVGYRFTDLTYAGDLIANIGESITSVLDKIKNMLVEFEYFYNLEGQFVFQKKRSVKETLWYFNNEEVVAPASAEYSYEFYGGNLITAFNNNPNLLNVKNDYSVWGEREGISGAKIPIHLRYAIDVKPTKYTQIWTTEWDNEQIDAYNKKHSTVLKGRTREEAKTFSVKGDAAVDWREIIYQMALDYYAYNILDDFELRVAEANSDLFPSGRTGYEQYYVDINSFWRELYDPNIKERKEDLEEQIETKEEEIEECQSRIKQYTLQLQNFDVFPNAPPLTNNIDKLNSYTERKNTTALLQVQETTLQLLQNQLQTLQEQLKVADLDCQDYYLDGRYVNWNKLVHKQPELLNFWFDFLDSQGELQQFNVKMIGNRPKVVNDNNVKSIYFRETPSVIYLQPQEEPNIKEGESGYKYIRIPVSYDNMFSISAQGIGAKDKLDDLLYQHGYCVESATITTVPIYHLEPNTRIYLYDKDTGLDGDYIASKFSIPLTYNGTMSITATKAAEERIV